MPVCPAGEASPRSTVLQWPSDGFRTCLIGNDTIKGLVQTRAAHEVWVVPQAAVVEQLAGVMRSKCAVLNEGGLKESVFAPVAVVGCYSGVKLTHGCASLFAAKG